MSNVYPVREKDNATKHQTHPGIIIFVIAVVGLLFVPFVVPNGQAYLRALVTPTIGVER
jgi:hypothetical protein